VVKADGARLCGVNHLTLLLQSVDSVHKLDFVQPVFVVKWVPTAGRVHEVRRLDRALQRHAECPAPKCRGVHDANLGAPMKSGGSSYTAGSLR
jgi:hypothetical protein